MEEQRSGFSDAPIEIVADQSKWPVVLGVISVVYGIGGLLCGVGGNAFNAFLMDVFSSFIGEVDMPPVVRLLAIANMIVALIMGGMLLVGASGLLRRRRSGVKWIKRWAISRLVLLVVMLLATLVTMPANVALQVQIAENRNEKLREQGQERFIKEVDEDALTRQVTLMTCLFTGLIAVYPTFLGLFVSRRKVDEDLQDWDP